jgi:tRNA (guanine-N7-)-methyltransferase
MSREVSQGYGLPYARLMMVATAPGPDTPRRHVRSFVRRGGRITAAQARALKELWPGFGIDFAPGLLNLDRVFGHQAPRLLEIGFGNGEALLAIARERSDWDCLGVEVYEPGVGRLLLQAQQAGLRNLRILCHDAVEALEHQLPDESIDETLVFFPDPWPKKRHHKRRLIQAPFATLLARKLKPGGVLRLATDWQPYAEHMLEVLNACELLVNAAADRAFALRPPIRPPTRFERRGQRLGHGVWDLEYRRIEAS